MDRPAPILHREHAHAIGGRDGGRAMPDVGGIALAMAIPKAMGGSGEGSNPEQLFALGYATCFNSALLFVARSLGIDATKARVAC